MFARTFEDMKEILMPQLLNCLLGLGKKHHFHNDGNCFTDRDQGNKMGWRLLARKHYFLYVKNLLASGITAEGATFPDVLLFFFFCGEQMQKSVSIGQAGWRIRGTVVKKDPLKDFSAFGKKEIKVDNPKMLFPHLQPKAGQSTKTPAVLPLIRLGNQPKTRCMQDTDCM